MKNSLLFTIALILAFSFSINAQNYKSLENLIDDMEEQADGLVKKTFQDIKKGNTLTEIEIERAFLAEQISASTKLMKRLVDDKYRISELRSAGKILLEIARSMPTDGSHISEWNTIKNSINSLNRELQSNQTEVIEQPEKVDENNISGRVFWTGMVDATVHLILQGTKIKTQTITGKPYPDGIPSFTRSLPNSGNITVGVKKKEGRGDVKMIQQPNSSNDYTAIVEIHDEGGGARSYTVEIFWSQN